jgi:hypothetical protein
LNNFRLSTLSELMAFVKEFHTTGLVWNPSGGNALQAGKLEQEQ